MKIEDLSLERWFKNRIKTVMKNYGWEEDKFTVEECDKTNSWTPCDMIAREYLNNGGGSAKGFLGMTRSECIKCYDYMCEKREYLIANDLINKSATNNSGFPLWNDYNF